tara:strand:- start:1130 stop:1573 length:444 start_codon:yes stop_codon:yes gene_type:complete
LETLSYKTRALNKSAVQKDWVIIDASNKVLGRLASEVSKIIRGKHKPLFSAHIDCGDNVVIINADKIRLTGKKWSDKVYIHHTGYPGGQRKQTPKEMYQKSSTLLIESAVKGMLPKNRLGRQIFKNLHTYAGIEHPHEAQKPKEVKI